MESVLNWVVPIVLFGAFGWFVFRRKKKLPFIPTKATGGIFGKPPTKLK